MISKTSGEYYVPTPIVQFLIDIVNIEPENQVLCIGFERERVESLFQQKNISNLVCISSQPHLEEHKNILGKFDAIICAPTFGLTVDQESVRTGESSEEFWIKWSLGHLTDEGRFSIIVPTGLLSNYSQQPIRKFINEQSSLKAIIELSAGWSKETALQASILLIEAGRTKQDVKMYRFNDTSKVIWNDITTHVLGSLSNFSTGNSGIYYSVTPREINPLRLDAQYYDPKYLQSITFDEKIFKKVRLGDITEIRSGDRFTKEEFQEEGVPFIQVRNITTDGLIVLSDTKKINPVIASESRSIAIAGDILITVAGTVGKVCLIKKSDAFSQVCIDTSIRKVRVIDKDKVLPEYLELFLRSKTAQLQIDRLASGSIIQVLSTPNLKDIEIHLPSIVKQKEIVKNFRDLIQMQTSKILSVFPKSDEMRAVVEPAPPNIPAPVPSPTPITPPPSWQEIVRTQYPFPISRAFTAYEEASKQNYTNRLKTLR